jgi:copper(I)-binding protein
MKKRNLLCSIVVTAIFSVTGAHAEGLSKSIFVSNAWVQAMPHSQKISAAYMTIRNNSNKEIIIISASCMIAGSTEIHQMNDMNGMMHMSMRASLHIPAQGKVTLRPGDIHIMLINLKKPVNKGDIVPITLHLQDKGSIIVNAQVKTADND